MCSNPGGHALLKKAVSESPLRGGCIEVEPDFTGGAGQRLAEDRAGGSATPVSAVFSISKVEV